MAIDKKVCVAISLSFTAGVIAGFILGQMVEITFDDDKKKGKVYGVDLKKDEKSEEPKKDEVDPAEKENPKDDDPSEFVSRGPAQIAQPGEPGINYNKVNKIIQENGYMTPEEVEKVLNDPDNQETFEEREEREEIERTEAMNEYRKKNKDKIVPIQSDEWDADFRSVDYDQADLYYFTTDGVLTDEDGNVLDESEYMGTRPRQFGWMDNDEDKIYIRNNPKETDYQVWKQRCASTDWWG